MPAKKPASGESKPKRKSPAKKGTATPAPTPPVDTKRVAGYEARKARTAQRDREESAAGRDIGAIPDVVDPDRRESCRESFRTFCETYFPDRFPLAWSPDHLTAIERIEDAVLRGGQFAFAMPRGSGKTTLCETAATWALLYGHRRFVVLIGSTEPAAEELLGSFKVTIETSDLLGEDFPEVCYPVRSLDGINHRANGQTLEGERTRIQWTGKEVQLPTVPGSAASASILRVAGITGRIRGLRASTPEGESIRPDLVIVDDPQTDESAHSPSQNKQRERILAGTILGLAGPRVKIAAFMPCTVIAPGDMADRVLDRDRHPAWQGSRARLLYARPTNDALWEEYGRLRADGLRAGRGLADATEFYRTHRAEMDAGARVGWEARFLPGEEISALQHAMNKWFADPVSFAAEYNNDPQPDHAPGSVIELSSEDVLAKLNRIPRGVVPRECTRLTCGVDVQGKVLFWMVCAWDERFGGSIVDYGAWPRQNRAYFSAADARPGLPDEFPGIPLAGQLYRGLTACVGELANRRFQIDGTKDGIGIERIVIDANWGQSTDTVYQFVRQAAQRTLLLPSHGRGIGASQMPMADWRKVPGDRVGWNWRIPVQSAGKGRHVIFDSNAWKSFLVDRIRTSPGAPGCLWIPGDRPYDHQLLADHLTSEYPVPTAGRGRTLQEWKVRPDRPENHWLDTLVLCAVGAATQGLNWTAADVSVTGPEGAPMPALPAPPPVKRVSFAELQKQRRAERERGRV